MKIRSTKYYVLFFFCIGLLVSCTVEQIIEPELDTVITVEAIYSQNEVRASVLSANQYPCFQPNACAPKIITNATITVKKENENGKVLNQNGLFYSLDISANAPYPGDVVTMQVNTNSEIYTATAVMPDTSKKIDLTFYNRKEPNLGLFLALDTINIQKAEALYILITNSDTSAPLYGYVITPDLKASALLPNNGAHNPELPGIYYIPESELLRANPLFKLDSADLYTVRARTITRESMDFYISFKQAIREADFSFNNGLLFAPPNNLYTNFDNNGFGMLHLFHEQIINEVVP